MRHLTQRVAWHDSRWNGTVCAAPRELHCVALEEVHKNRDDAAEDALAGAQWSSLRRSQQPPCVREAGARS